MTDTGCVVCGDRRRELHNEIRKQERNTRAGRPVSTDIIARIKTEIAQCRSEGHAAHTRAHVNATANRWGTHVEATL